MAYLTINTVDLIQAIVEIARAQGLIPEVFAVKSRRRNTRHMRGIRLHGMPTPDGLAIPTIYLINSYGGECALTLRIGIYEFACANGLMLGRDFYSATIRHVDGPKARTWLDQLPEFVAGAIAAARRMVTERARLQAIPCSEFQTRVAIAALVAAKVIGKRAAEAAARVAKPDARPHPKDQEPTVWAAYNAINEQVRLAGRSEEKALQVDAKILETLLAAAA